MATIRYTKTKFREPGLVSESSYNQLKAVINNNPDIVIEPKSETFSEHFSNVFKMGGICLAVSIIFSAFGDHSLTVIVAVLSFVMFLGCLLNLILEGPSYATFVKTKSEYFTRLKYAIQNTNSYNEFVLSFYSNKKR